MSNLLINHIYRKCKPKCQIFRKNKYIITNETSIKNLPYTLTLVSFPLILNVPKEAYPEIDSLVDLFLKKGGKFEEWKDGEWKKENPETKHEHFQNLYATAKRPLRPKRLQRSNPKS